MATHVAFKQGLHSALTEKKGSYAPGAFYLTTDTNRFFYAKDADTIVDLNQYIQIWDKANLPTTTDVPNIKEGDIYYWSSKNILAIVKTVSGGEVEWTQLNPDTTLVKSTNAVATSTISDGAKVVTTIADSAGNTATGNFSIIGGNNVTVSQSGGVITVASDPGKDHQYDLTTVSNTDKGVILLDGSESDDTQVSVLGAGITNVSSDGSGNITIDTPERPVTSVTTSFDANGNLIIGVETTDGGTTGSHAMSVTYGENNGTTAKFNTSGVMALDVYTKDETDDKITDALASFDAMQYMGTVSASDANNKLASTANVGEVYKASSAIDTYNAKIGDLLISKGTDGNVTWEVVPSGDDQVITGTVTNTDSQVSVAVSDGNVLAGLILKEDAPADSRAIIDLATTISGKTATTTLKHGNAGTGTAQTIANATDNTTLDANTSGQKKVVTVNSVESLLLDGAGHVAGVTLQKYELNDTHAIVGNKLATFGNSSTTASNIVPFASSTTMTWGITLDGTAHTGSWDISSNTLSFTSTANSNDLVIDLEWGTF